MTLHNKKINFSGTATVGPKGQVVIPCETREKLGIKPGDKLIALEIEGHHSITFITSDQVQVMIDMLNSKTGFLEDVKAVLSQEEKNAS